MQIDKQYGNIESICGIYCISNSKYFYIGLSSDIRKRWNSHRSHLRRGIHDNSFMQNVYNKHYLDDPFKYEIVCTCERQDLATLEKTIYDEYCRKYFNKIPMNLANCGVTSTWTEEMKQKASVSHKGKVFTEEHCKNISRGQTGIKRLKQRIPVVQLSLEGDLIKIWDSPVTVQEELGIHVQMNRKSCGGFQWQRYEDWLNNPKKAVKYKNIQEVYQYSKNGNFIRKYKSIQEAVDITGIRHSSISNAIHGRNKTAGGFIWKT